MVSSAARDVVVPASVAADAAFQFAVVTLAMARAEVGAT